MNFERVVFGFFLILAFALNGVFVLGEFENPDHHNLWVLTMTILVGLIATGLKLGDRSQVGAILLAASLVADFLLMAAGILWVIAENDTTGPVAGSAVRLIVSLAVGALMANVVSMAMLVGDTLMSRR